MEFSPQSPGLNPIENHWEELYGRIRTIKTTQEAKTQQTFKDCWK